MYDSLAAALWRTRSYIKPELRHFIAYGMLVGAGMLLELATFLFGFDLLTNKVFLGEALTETQAGMLGLPVAEYVTVEQLSESSRYLLRNIFLVIMVTTLAIGFFLGAVLPYYLTWILQRVNQHLRVSMMDQAVHLSLRYHNDSQVGDAIYRVYQDSAMVTNVIQNGLILPLTMLGNYAIAFAALFFFAPYLGLLFLIAGGVSVAIAYVFTPVIRRRSELARRANSVLTSHIQESVGSVRLFKSCGAEDGAISKFDGRSQYALDRAYDIRKSVATLNLCVALVTGVVVLVADYVMAHWVWEGSATYGYGVVALVGFAIWNLGAFQAARDRSVSITNASVELANLWSLLQDMKVGLGRAFFLLDLEPEIVDRPNALPMPGITKGIRFDHVRFAYDQEQPILRDVSFEAVPGTVTAIVGSTGAGKSTLLNLLLRLYEIDSGTLTIDDVDQRDIRVQALRHAIAVVLQENVLFPTSIKDNIKYAAPNATDDEIRAAARVACADTFIEALSEGYDTTLGERGSKLSTGQRQRLSIARAILKGAPILILDEPTASLDVATEHRVLQQLAAWGTDKIIFFVTHRIATIRHADQILFLEDGVIAERGSHEQLMADTIGKYHHFVMTELEVAS
ncbi:MAG: ABC transporter ATP-binding protein [Gammaproteobacteria bacterium]|nr:ABC transporter ATP-binding protein [Gammaproteobacteria bacterium]